MWHSGPCFMCVFPNSSALLIFSLFFFLPLSWYFPQKTGWGGVKWKIHIPARPQYQCSFIFLAIGLAAYLFYFLYFKSLFVISNDDTNMNFWEAFLICSVVQFSSSFSKSAPPPLLCPVPKIYISAYCCRCIFSVLSERANAIKVWANAI